MAAAFSEKYEDLALHATEWDFVSPEIRRLRVRRERDAVRAPSNVVRHIHARYKRKNTTRSVHGRRARHEGVPLRVQETERRVLSPAQKDVELHQERSRRSVIRAIESRGPMQITFAVFN